MTLIELIAVLSVVALISALGIPRLTGRGDRFAVESAAADVTTAFAVARQMAIAGLGNVAVRIDSLGRNVTVRRGNDTLLVRRLGLVHGVRVRANRDSMAYTPLGHGYGAANQSVFITRGAAAETVVVSRLGRVRFRS